MSGHRAFSRLTEDFPPERRKRIEARKRDIRAAMLLHELRQARAMDGMLIVDAVETDALKPQ